MKYALVVTLLFIASCGFNHKANEYNTINWIRQAHRPVICTTLGYNAIGYPIYNLTDADSNEYVSGYISIYLRDTIK